MKLIDLKESETNNFENMIQKKYNIKTFMLMDRNDNSIELSMIEIEKEQRSQGIGSKIMDELIAFADRNNKRIILRVGLSDKRHGTTSRSRLVKFYKRFDFIENKGRNKDFTITHGMFRNPK